MSHSIYTTEAIILHRVSTGEADNTLWLLTDALGLLVARAQSARKSNAKMRGHLQLFSLVRVSLVRGKYVWRITGTESGSMHSPRSLRTEALSTFARIATFVRRMTLADALSTSELFDMIKTARHELATEESDAERLELETIAKVLVHLGYIHTDILTTIDKRDISQNKLAQVVNNAIIESHL